MTHTNGETDPKLLDVLPDPTTYLDISLVSNESFKHHSGFDLTAENLAVGDSAAPEKYIVLGTTRVEEFARQIALEKGLKSEMIRFWVMVKRVNKTIRPSHPLLQFDMTLEGAFKNQCSRDRRYWLWLEVKALGKEVSWPLAPASKNLILVFLKYVDGLNLTVIGIGHIYVHTSDKLSVLIPHITKLMNWPENTQVVLLEVMLKLVIGGSTETNRVFLTGNQTQNDHTNTI